MDKQIDFRMITPCGECCAGCLKKQDGFCQGCLESGVTEMRLLMIGMPYIFSSSSPVLTRCSAFFVILS